MRQPNFRRGRGRGNARRPSGRNQTFDSSGPNVKVRGSAAQVLEKYLALARDATASGDRIMAENYFQHAEHYYRVISANGASPERSQSSQGGNGKAEEDQSRQAQEQASPDAQPEAKPLEAEQNATATCTAENKEAPEEEQAPA